MSMDDGDRAAAENIERLERKLAEVRAERDRLRAVVRKLVDVAGIEVNGDEIVYADTEYGAANPLTDAEMVAYRAALDVSGDMGGEA